MLRVIGAPADSVGPAPSGPLRGSERAPTVLRQAGLIEALGAVDAGDLPVRIEGRDRDSETGVRGWPDVAATTDVVRTAVIAALHAGDLPVVIGGCCCIAPGAVAGARDALGVVGVAYVDGHLDLYDGRTSTTGEAADMPASVIAGGGPDAWADLVESPFAPAGGVVLLGAADRPAARRDGSLMPEDLGLPGELDPESLRDLGMLRAGNDTEIALTTVVENYWLHLDLDVLDTDVFPATDHPGRTGLDWSELEELLGPLGRSAALVGVSIACFNPDLDPTGDQAPRIVALLASVLGEPSVG
jgi:arginase